MMKLSFFAFVSGKAYARHKSKNLSKIQHKKNRTSAVRKNSAECDRVLGISPQRVLLLSLSKRIGKDYGMITLGRREERKKPDHSVRTDPRMRSQK